MRIASGCLIIAGAGLFGQGTPGTVQPVPSLRADASTAIVLQPPAPSEAAADYLPSPSPVQSSDSSQAASI
jgi:hypothetical protein